MYFIDITSYIDPGAEHKTQDPEVEGTNPIKENVLNTLRIFTFLYTAGLLDRYPESSH